jgi:hypothetical protein
MFTLLRDATLALYADTDFPRRLLVPHFFEISDEFRRDLWVVVKSASAEMNVHSWQGLVAGTCGHQTRHLDQRSAQNPKCIVLFAKMSLQDFTTSSGQKDLHAWSSMHVLVRGSNRILISHTLIYGDSGTCLCCRCRKQRREIEVLHSNRSQKESAANWTELP